MKIKCLTNKDTPLLMCKLYLLIAIAKCLSETTKNKDLFLVHKFKGFNPPWTLRVVSQDKIHYGRPESMQIDNKERPRHTAPQRHTHINLLPPTCRVIPSPDSLESNMR